MTFFCMRPVRNQREENPFGGYAYRTIGRLHRPARCRVRQRRRRAVRRRTAGRPAKPGAQHRRCFCCPGRRSGCRGHQDLNRHCRRGARRARRARSQTCQGRGRGAGEVRAKAVQAESSAADKAANQKVYDQKNGATTLA